MYMRDCAPVNIQINAKGDATVPGGGLLLVRRGWVDVGVAADAEGEGGSERDGAGRGEGGGACALHLINLNPN